MCKDLIIIVHNIKKLDGVEIFNNKRMAKCIFFVLIPDYYKALFHTETKQFKNLFLLNYS